MRLVLDLQGAQSQGCLHGIGRYSLAIAQAIARQAGQNEVWLALSGRFPDSLEPLRAAFAGLIASERIRVFELPGPVAEDDLANSWRMQTAELLREKFLADLQPDVVHVSTLFEGFDNEVVASVSRHSIAPTAVTLYDLDPTLLSESDQGEPLKQRHYLRHAQSLKRADLILTISEPLRQRVVEILQIARERIAVIGTGAEPSFQSEWISPEKEVTLLAQCGLRRPFLLCPGGFEPEKNLETLMEAFALVPREIRTVHQLAVVGQVRDEELQKIILLARKVGLTADEVVFVREVSENDLRGLISMCTLSVFPSPHGGFGLTVLKAMAGGAPVIGTDATGIAEIVGREDALFNPERPENIASRLRQTLSNPELRRSLTTWGYQRAKTFTWEACARAALTAFRTLDAKRQRDHPVTNHLTTRRRPLLAFISPVPPERTGIAGYAARLLPNLARHYEIVCVVDQSAVTDPWITAEFPIKNVRWFEENACRFERVLYHFGNSPSHKHMFELLKRQLGVVVLHDFYLGHAVKWMDVYGYSSSSFCKTLYNSHGFSALNKNQVDGRDATVAGYPCNWEVLRSSIGVLVHSKQATDLARQWYGNQVSASVRQIPFLPFAPEPVDRAAARKRLNCPEDAFIVCSFGWVTPMKLNNRLLDAWLSSPLSCDETCYLIFVGENTGGEYGQRLLDRIAGSHAASRILITGYVEVSQYRDYLAAADLAVQLRTGNRGETAATIFDCLARKVPLIINAHGSGAELPHDVAIMLDDRFTDEALSIALDRLRKNAGLRQSLATRGALYLNEVHHPERVADLYRNSIEDLYHNSPKTRDQDLVQAIARSASPAEPGEADLAMTANAFAINGDRAGPAQILVDVSIVADLDLRTGIQRVTRAILMALITDPPPGYRIEPVRACRGRYLYARRFACQCLGLTDDSLVDDPVELSSADIFIGLDWCSAGVLSLKPWFLEQRRRGTKIVFICYDMLPQLRPEFFPPNGWHDWINTVTAVAGGVICISRTVADELYEWLTGANAPRRGPLSIGFFHLGADLQASLPSKGLTEDAAAVLAQLRRRTNFLTVGTVESRKGYRQVLNAMELLWADGVDANLTIVGKKGWMIDDVAERIHRHPELNRRLFWLQGISDEMLEEVYRAASALLAASEGEGFGLPLIEAAQYGLPIIARDIAIFREVAGEHAYYFSAKDAEGLADALRTWMHLGDAVPPSAGIPRLTWRQSSRQLLDIVIGNGWYRACSETLERGGRSLSATNSRFHLASID